MSFSWEEAYKKMLDIVYPNRVETIYDLTLLSEVDNDTSK